MAHDEMTMRPSELCGVRDAMRTMPKLVRALNDGETEKVVLLKHNKVVGVILDIDDYSEMVEKRKEVADDPSHAQDGGQQ